MTDDLRDLLIFFDEFAETEYTTTLMRSDLNLSNSEYEPQREKFMKYFHSQLKRGANDISGFWERTSNWCESEVIRDSIKEAEGKHIKRELKQVEKYKNPQWGKVYRALKADELYVCAVTTVLKPVPDDGFHRLFLIKTKKGEFQIVCYDTRLRERDETDIGYDMDDLFISLGEKIFTERIE